MYLIIGSTPYVRIKFVTENIMDNVENLIIMFRQKNATLHFFIPISENAKEEIVDKEEFEEVWEFSFNKETCICMLHLTEEQTSRLYEGFCEVQAKITTTDGNICLTDIMKIEIKR